MSSCRLTLDAAPNQTLGGMNLYATKPRAFGTQDQDAGHPAVVPGAVVIDAARQQEQLRAAIASRQVIGEVVGILRAQSDLSSAQALEMLSRASRRTQPNSGISPSRSRTGPEQGASPSDSPSPAPRTRRRPYPPTGASKGATRATTAGTTNAGPAHSDVLRHHRVPPAGFEPATHGLGNRCSIP
jgi:hypothetical protein